MNTPASIRLSAKVQLVERYNLPHTKKFIVAIGFESIKSGFDSFIEGDNATFKIVSPDIPSTTHDITQLINNLNPIENSAEAHSSLIAFPWVNTVYFIWSLGVEAEAYEGTNIPLGYLMNGTKIFIEAFGKIYAYTFPETLDLTNPSTLALRTGGSMLFTEEE